MFKKIVTALAAAFTVNATHIDATADLVNAAQSFYGNGSV